MAESDRQNAFAHRSLWVSFAIAIGVFVFFVVRDEPVTGALIGLFLAGAGFFEYKRRQRDAEMMNRGGEDPPEEDRFR